MSSEINNEGVWRTNNKKSIYLELYSSYKFNILWLCLSRKCAKTKAISVIAPCVKHLFHQRKNEIACDKHILPNQKRNTNKSSSESENSCIKCRSTLNKIWQKTVGEEQIISEANKSSLNFHLAKCLPRSRKALHNRFHFVVYKRLLA